MAFFVLGSKMRGEGQRPAADGGPYKGEEKGAGLNTRHYTSGR